MQTSGSTVPEHDRPEDVRDWLPADHSERACELLGMVERNEVHDETLYVALAQTHALVAQVKSRWS